MAYQKRITHQIGGNTAGATANIVTGSYFLAGGNNVTLSQNANSVTISAGAGGAGVTPALSGSNGSFTYSTATFGNLNGLSFYSSNGSMVGSYTVPNVPAQTEYVFSNSNGVTFGTNGSTVTASHNGLTSQSNQALSAANGSFTFQTATFANSNGVSFSTGTQGIYATVKTDYLTTARASNDAVGLNTAQSNVTWTVNSSGISLDARGYAGTQTGATNASVTANSNGISVSVGDYLTSQSNQALSAANGSFTFQTATFANSNGVSFSTGTQGIYATVQTNYLTTARASNDAIGLNTAQSNVTWTVNSSGLSLDARGYAGTNTGATNASITVNSGGVSVSVGNYLTSQSNQALSAANGSFTFQTATFANSNGISFSTGTQGLYASHNGLTTARASNDGVGLNTAQSNVTWTVNSSGISLDARGYAGTGTTFNGTNVSGSVTLNSNGLNLALSAGAGGGVTPVASASNGSFSFTTLAFSNANNVTFGTSAGSIITASVAAPGAAAENNWFNLVGANTAGNTTASGSTIAMSGINLTLSGTNGSAINISAPATSSLSATGLVSISTNGSTISIGVADKTFNNWEVFPQGNNTTFSSMGQNSFYLQKLHPEVNYSFNHFELRASGSFVSSTNSQVVAHSINYGLYSKNGASYSSISTSQMAITASYNSNTAMGYTISQDAGSFTTSSGGTAIASLMSGYKHFYLPFTSTITAGGQYAFGLHISSATTVGTSPMRLAILNHTNVNNLTMGKIYATTVLASNASFVGDFAQGVGSVTTNAMPSSIAETALTNAVSQARIYMQLD